MHHVILYSLVGVYLLNPQSKAFFNARRIFSDQSEIQRNANVYIGLLCAEACSILTQHQLQSENAVDKFIHSEND
jgi:hypothetical protein